MVHYIRFLRTPQVSDTKKKTLDVSAVLCITTDLGDAFYARRLDLVIQVVVANHPQQVLHSQNVIWNDGLRALKVNIACSSRLLSRYVQVHVAAVRPSSALVPTVVDVWSDMFHLSDKQRSEPIVERRLTLPNDSVLRSWEETGDSIARHIWDASLGFLLYFEQLMNHEKCPATAAINDLITNPTLRRLRVLELGAGCGIVGIAFAQLVKCEMLLTDLEEAQEILGLNMKKATPLAGSSIQNKVLHWGSNIDDRSNAKFDLVLMSDCIYNPDSSVKLVDTLHQLSMHAPNMLFLVGFKRRHDGDTVFFNRMTELGFEVVEECTIHLPHDITDYDVSIPTIEFYIYRGPAIPT